LVGYMGVSTLAEVSAALLAAGMRATTPAAVIEQGTLAGQRSVRGTVADLVAIAKDKGIRPPAIFVIGQVVAHAEALAPLITRPLRGVRIGMFAPCSTLAQSLEQGGAEVLVAPNPWTAAARLVLGSAPLSGWLIRTRHELDALDSEPTARAVLGNVTLWCPNAELASLARARGWANATDVGSPLFHDQKEERSVWQLSSPSPI